MKLIEKCRHSIRLRLWLLLAAMSASILALATALFGAHGWKMQQDQNEDHLVAMTRLVALNSAAALAFDDTEAAAEDLTGVRALPSILYAGIIRTNGEVFVENHAPGHEACKPARGYTTDPSVHRKRACLCVTSPVRLGERIIGHVHLKQELPALRHQVATMLGVSGAVFLATLFVALLLAARIGGTISRPITRLAANVRAISLPDRIDLSEFSRAQDEIGDLARGINDMLENLAASRSELERSLSAQRALFDTIPMPVYGKDHDLAFSALNQRFAAEVAGRPPAEIIGRTQEEVPGRYDAETLAVIRRHENEVLKNSTAHAFEIPATDATGTARIYNVCLGLNRDAGGHTTGIIGIMQDITEIRRIGKELIDVSMREQQRLARDLHDNLGQLLTATAVKLKTLESSLDPAHTAPRAAIAPMIELINRCAREARALSHGLNPVDVERGGLVRALEKLASSSEIYAHLTCRFTADDHLPETDKDVSNQLYRIAQEAVNNAVRHAGATRIDIRLVHEDDHAILVVADDGQGLPANPGTAAGMGLRIMNQRALLIHGELTCRTRTEGGTEVVCRCPITPEPS